MTIKQLKNNRFLIEELVKRDFKKKYKRSVLGVAWSLINPLMSLLIMRVVFTRFFGSSIEHYTAYLFCGNILFSYFSESTSEGVMTLKTNASIFSKVNIPKPFFILAKNAQVFINFLITLLVFLVLCLFDGIRFSPRFLLLAYPVVMMTLFNLGVGMVLSALFVFFRDIQYLWSIVLQLLTYLSAIFYSIDLFSPRVQNLFLLNPIYVFIRYFRQIVINGVVPSPQFHALAAFYALAALGAGLFMYRRYNDEFLYYL